jgi:hypothetical protein
MTALHSINRQILKQWVDGNFSDKEVEQQLQQLQLSETEIELYLMEYKKQKLQKRTTLGITCFVAGGFIGFLSCILTIANPFPELYNTILFGLTSLAILVIFAGLYFLFE